MCDSSKPGLTIKAATLADGSQTDLFVKDGYFVAEPSLGAEVIDASGLLVIPGLVDLHTHLREPGGEASETIATGTAAAARGGFTCVHAMANTNPVTDDVNRVAHIRELAADAKAQVQVVSAITKGLAGQQLVDFAGLADAGVTMFSDDGHCVMNAGLMRQAMDAAKRHDLLLAQHSQDHDLADGEACVDEKTIAAKLGLKGWPWAAEASIIARDVMLAELTGARIHVCHVSTAESIDVVRWAKARGIKVSAEATAHHLLLTSDHLDGLDTTFKVNPPLRGVEDVQAVREALADGTIDIVGTDHAPHETASKNLAFPQAKPGMTGLEQALGVVIEVLINSGLANWSRLVEAMSYEPAKLGKVKNQGLPVAVGNPANFVLIDPKRRSIVDKNVSLSKGRNNPFHGMDLPDPVIATYWAGRCTFNAR